MRTLRSNLNWLGAIATLLGAACGPTTITGNTVNIEDATLDIDAEGNIDQVESGGRITVNLTAENVVLVEPSATPPPDQVDVAGHFQIYLDSLDTEPVLVTAQTRVEVTVPAQTPPGQHKLLCRLHKHDRTPTSVVVELSFTVGVRTSTTGGE
jgi:hypothetical protein